MVTKLLIGVSLFIAVLAAACAGGETPAPAKPTVQADATPAATQVIEADPVASEAHLETATALHESGRLDDAIFEYGEAILRN